MKIELPVLSFPDILMEESTTSLLYVGTITAEKKALCAILLPCTKNSDELLLRWWSVSRQIRISTLISNLDFQSWLLSLLGNPFSLQYFILLKNICFNPPVFGLLSLTVLSLQFGSTLGLNWSPNLAKFLVKWIRPWLRTYRWSADAYFLLQW